MQQTGKCLNLIIWIVGTCPPPDAIEKVRTCVRTVTVTVLIGIYTELFPPRNLHLILGYFVCCVRCYYLLLLFLLICMPPPSLHSRVCPHPLLIIPTLTAPALPPLPNSPPHSPRHSQTHLHNSSPPPPPPLSLPLLETLPAELLESNM